MNKEKIIEKLQQNIKSKFCYIPNAIHSMKVLSATGPLIIDSNLNCDMFNIICCQSPTDIAEVDNIVRYFQKRQKPAAWWVGFQSDPPQLKNKLESLGFNNEEAELAMVASLENISGKEMKALTIKEVNATDSLNDFIGVISKLIPNESAQINQYFNQGAHIILNAESRLKCFVGYSDDKPVSTATVFLAEEVAGIFDIITMPEARGQGIGTAMTIAAMNAGKKHGYKYATLTATNDAKFVYEKIGFASLNEMCVYPIK